MAVDRLRRRRLSSANYSATTEHSVFFVSAHRREFAESFGRKKRRATRAACQLDKDYDGLHC